METERKHFIAISYESDVTYRLATVLSECLISSGIPMWLCRRITGKEVPTGGETWRAFENNWQTVWLENARKANGVLVITGQGGYAEPNTGLQEEMKFVRRLETQNPQRVRHLIVPSEICDLRIPELAKPSVPPLAEDRLGYEKAEQWAKSSAVDDLFKLGSLREKWIDGVRGELTKWAEQMFLLQPIYAETSHPPKEVKLNSAPEKKESFSAYGYDVRNWARQNIYRIDWAVIACQSIYDLKITCMVCGEEWNDYPANPPSKCPSCGYTGEESSKQYP